MSDVRGASRGKGFEAVLGAVEPQYGGYTGEGVCGRGGKVLRKCMG